MSVATVESLKILLSSSASGLSDALLEKVLNSALLKVVKDGVPILHKSFGELQEYYAASILEATGQIQGPLASKSIADVSESYNTSGKSYRDIYSQTLRDVVGKKGFIV
jgi:hypothetical protein